MVHFAEKKIQNRYELGFNKFKIKFDCLKFEESVVKQIHYITKDT